MYYSSSAVLAAGNQYSINAEMNMTNITSSMAFVFFVK